MTHSKWLKKYTKVQFLQGILEQRHLYLGDPSAWDDKNDAHCLSRYGRLKNLKDIRATCLTSAPDRFHFWQVFGSCIDGVCLWFDAELLKAHLKKNPSLMAQFCIYETPKAVSKFGREKLPFLKRKQYEDESEFRVVATSSSVGGAMQSLSFPPRSLKRIYLNSWLEEPELENQKASLQSYLVGDLAHVTVKQNRMLKYGKWTDAVDKIA